MHDENFERILNKIIEITFENKLNIYAILGNIIYISNYTSDELDKNNYNKFLNIKNIIPDNVKKNIRYIIGKTIVRAQRIEKNNMMKYMPKITDIFSKIILLKDIDYGEYREIEEN